MAEARLRLEEERVAREAAAGEAVARKKAAEDAERKREERAKVERERKKLLEESMRLVREAEEAAREAADDGARAEAENKAAELRREAEKKARASAGPSRSGIMSTVHRLLAELEDKKEQVCFRFLLHVCWLFPCLVCLSPHVRRFARPNALGPSLTDSFLLLQVRVDAARQLKEVVAMTGEGRTYVQEALVNLCRPNLDTSDEAKKNAVEYLIKVVDSATDCSTCSKRPSPYSIETCFRSSPASS